MLLFTHKYLFLRIKNEIQWKLKYNKSILIQLNKSKYLFLINFFNLSTFNSHLRVNFLFNFLFNLFKLNIKLFFLLSNNFNTEQISLNKYLALNPLKEYNYIFLLRTTINKKLLTFLKNINLPIFFITDLKNNQKYFDYFLLIKNYNSIIEFFFIELFIHFYSTNQNNQQITNKKNYYYINLLNTIKKNV